MHGICERVGVELESTSPPPYIVVEGVGGLKFEPTKHAPTKQGKHVPTKHGENMFPCPWCSHMGPHYLPTLSTICGGCRPHHGPPPTPLSSHKALPPQGGAPKRPKNSSHEPWDLVFSHWDKMFSA